MTVWKPGLWGGDGRDMSVATPRGMLPSLPRTRSTRASGCWQTRASPWGAHTVAQSARLIAPGRVVFVVFARSPALPQCAWEGTLASRSAVYPQAGQARPEVPCQHVALVHVFEYVSPYRDASAASTIASGTCVVCIDYRHCDGRAA